MIIATAFYETDWFKAVVYILIAMGVARAVDFVLARRDRAMLKLLGKEPDRADRTRYIMIRRLVFIGILFIGVGIALIQIPAVSTLARAMLASAARSYLHRHGVAVGQNVVLVTGCDAAYAAALELRVAGVRVALIADVRSDASGGPLEIARQAGIEVVTGATVLGTRGRLGATSAHPN